jgi:hypothetical protein
MDAGEDMSCKEGDVELGKDGRWRKCVSGDWMRTTHAPVITGPGVGEFLTIDSREELDDPKIQQAIANKKMQVVVAFIRVPDSD